MGEPIEERTEDGGGDDDGIVQIAGYNDSVRQVAEA
ncbi:hypothetical protein J2W40_003662 [Sphingobium xenophagum]|uniref:Uncharacterized protein n=1 Tax=Sphingobium xenophagum TaxID=121428 RepID=A0ABU1X5F8_SPHXE|nr:hypothetical protein [Sphingobium xenophagum]